MILSLRLCTLFTFNTFIPFIKIIYHNEMGVGGRGTYSPDDGRSEYRVQKIQAGKGRFSSFWPILPCWGFVVCWAWVLGLVSCKMSAIKNPVPLMMLEWKFCKRAQRTFHSGACASTQLDSQSGLTAAYARAKRDREGEECVDEPSWGRGERRDKKQPVDKARV